MSEPFTIVAAVNREPELQRNLMRSPELLAGGNQLIVRRSYRSAGTAYNGALDAADHDLVLFVHQDVYLPEGWFDDLRDCVATLEDARVPWGVLGCFGSRAGATGGLGRLYTRGMGRHGRFLRHPEPVETLDEIVLVFRKSSGLRFDPDLPHFHFYGTDLCMSARERGLVNYAFQGFCVHNTNQLLMLPKEFYECYRYVRRKWAKYLPIHASCMTVTAGNGQLYRRLVREAGQRLLRRPRLGLTRVEDPRVFTNAG
jgi:hypothetical protein